jgi:hypothetical protein
MDSTPLKGTQRPTLPNSLLWAVGRLIPAVDVRDGIERSESSSNEFRPSTYHLHFITSDRKRGGHLLDGEFLNAVVEVETLQDWQIALPSNPAFGAKL